MFIPYPNWPVLQLPLETESPCWGSTETRARLSCLFPDLNQDLNPDPNPGALLTVGSSPLSIFMVRSCSYASGKPSARIGGASGSETLTVRTKGETPGLRECRKRGPLPAWGHQERVHRRVVSIGCVQGRVSHPQRCGHLEPDDSSL